MKTIENLLLLILIILSTGCVLAGSVFVCGVSEKPIDNLMLYVKNAGNEDDDDFDDDVDPDDLYDDDDEDFGDDETDETEPEDTEDESGIDITVDETDDPEEITSEPSTETTTTEVTTEETTTRRETVAPRETVPYLANQNVDPAEYFSTALFIGDSRTVGLKSYGKIKADYFARNSASNFSLWKEKKIPTLNNRVVDLATFLQEKQYDKIFILLGVNELGYSPTKCADKMLENCKKILGYQPNAKIIIQSNFHTSLSKDYYNADINNERIQNLNSKLAEICDNERIFFLDIQDIFDDKTHHFSTSYSRDGVHPYAKSYKIWADYLKNYGKY